jgi:hypothetical protein
MPRNRFGQLSWSPLSLLLSVSDRCPFCVSASLFPSCSMPRDRFGQLSWRPRVPSLLPREKEEEIRKNLKEYSRRYDEEDEALLLQVCAVY